MLMTDNMTENKAANLRGGGPSTGTYHNGGAA